MAKEKIIDRIRKLLATADEASGATEHERDVAMQKAQSLLLKHALELGDIGEVEKEQGKIGEGYITSERPYWHGLLLHRIAPFFFCRVYLAKGGPRSQYQTWAVVGRESNRDALIAIWTYCTAQMSGMLYKELRARDKRAQYALIALGQYMEEFGPFKDKTTKGVKVEAWEFALSDFQDRLSTMDGEDQLDLISDLCNIAHNYAGEVRPFIKRGELAVAIVENLGVWKRSFCAGMVDVVGRNVKAFYDKTVESAKKTGKELVVAENEALQRYMDDLNLESKHSEGKLDFEGLAAGAAAGSKVDVSGAKNKVARNLTKELTA